MITVRWSAENEQRSIFLAPPLLASSSSHGPFDQHLRNPVRLDEECIHVRSMYVCMYITLSVGFRWPEAYGQEYIDRV